MADRDPRDIPDLVVPPQRVRPAEPTVSARPQAIDLPLPDDDDHLEIERGGALSAAPAMSGSRPPPARLRAPPSLELAQPRRPAPAPRVAIGPSSGERLVARAVALALCALTFGGLAKLAHRSGRGVLRLAPHAFDASSLAQSGSGAALLLVLAIAFGYVGFRLEPRSYALVASAGALLLSSLAMITIALVATDEHTLPPDGALILPYLVPLAVALLGIAITLRGSLKYLDGARLQAIAAGIIGGGLLFAALELSGRSLF